MLREGDCLITTSQPPELFSGDPSYRHDHDLTTKSPADKLYRGLQTCQQGRYVQCILAEPSSHSEREGKVLL
jgi:hypothetical protein